MKARVGFFTVDTWGSIRVAARIEILDPYPKTAVFFPRECCNAESVIHRGATNTASGHFSTEAEARAWADEMLKAVALVTSERTINACCVEDEEIEVTIKPRRGTYIPSVL